MKRNTHTVHHQAIRLLIGTDMAALRLSVIIIFALFGTYKWFAFEASSLHHLLPGTWLGGAVSMARCAECQLFAGGGGKHHPDCADYRFF